MTPLGSTSRIHLRDGVVTIQNSDGRVIATMSGPIATVHLAADGDEMLITGSTRPGAVVEGQRAPTHEELDEVDRILDGCP